MKSPVNSALCPCGSNKPFDVCCGPYIKGEKTPPTAKALMRSRYVAYALGKESYILDTWDPRTRPENQPVLSEDLEWTGLEIVYTKKGSRKDSTGVVSFRAHYRSRNQINVMAETSRFVKKEGKWYYIGSE